MHTPDYLHDGKIIIHTMIELIERRRKSYMNRKSVERHGSDIFVMISQGLWRSVKSTLKPINNDKKKNNNKVNIQHLLAHYTRVSMHSTIYTNSAERQVQ